MPRRRAHQPVLFAPASVAKANATIKRSWHWPDAGSTCSGPCSVTGKPSGRTSRSPLDKPLGCDHQELRSLVTATMAPALLRHVGTGGPAGTRRGGGAGRTSPAPRLVFNGTLLLEMPSPPARNCRDLISRPQRVPVRLMIEHATCAGSSWLGRRTRARGPARSHRREHLALHTRYYCRAGRVSRRSRVRGNSDQSFPPI